MKRLHTRQRLSFIVSGWYIWDQLYSLLWRHNEPAISSIVDIIHKLLSRSSSIVHLVPFSLHLLYLRFLHHLQNPKRNRKTLDREISKRIFFTLSWGKDLFFLSPRVCSLVRQNLESSLIALGSLIFDCQLSESSPLFLNVPFHFRI